MNDTALSKIFWLLLRKSFQRKIAETFNLHVARDIMKSAKVNYYTILRNFQSFGKHNPKLVDILLTALVAAIFKAGNGRISVAQMDSILTDSMESSHIFKKSFEKDDHFSRNWQDKRYSQALESKKRKYPSDFVCDFIYGENYNEYGINYYECAIYKLLRQEGCPELTSLFCKFDYVMAKHMGATLKRTKTLVTGGDFCDFWYTKI